MTDRLRIILIYVVIFVTIALIEFEIAKPVPSLLGLVINVVLIPTGSIVFGMLLVTLFGTKR